MGVKGCVLGAGAWGTALATVLAYNGFQVVMYDQDPQIIDSINLEHTSPRLEGIELTQRIRGCSELAQAMEGAAIVVSAVPSGALEAVVPKACSTMPSEAVLVSATKGFNPAARSRPTQTWIAQDPSLESRIVAISGPNFAIEIARRLPAATVVASENKAACEAAQIAFMTPYLRVYTHWDVAGVELGGALKNIIAIACGMVEGMGLGYNTQAAVISRGIAEVTRLGVALGADSSTFAGLSGLGDLVLTSTGHLSRNRQAGIAIGRGETIGSFMERTGYTVEGVATVESAMKLAQDRNIVMPITEIVYKGLYLGVSPEQGLAELMGRDRRSEHE